MSKSTAWSSQFTGFRSLTLGGGVLVEVEIAAPVAGTVAPITATVAIWAVTSFLFNGSNGGILEAVLGRGRRDGIVVISGYKQIIKKPIKPATSHGCLIDKKFSIRRHI